MYSMNTSEAASVKVGLGQWKRLDGGGRDRRSVDALVHTIAHISRLIHVIEYICISIDRGRCHIWDQIGYRDMAKVPPASDVKRSRCRHCHVMPNFMS